MVRRRAIYALVTVLLAGLGCNLPARMAMTPTRTPSSPSPSDAVSVLPVATETAGPDIEPTWTTEPTTGRGVGEGTLFPAGFMLLSESGEVVTFYNLAGEPLGIIQTPGLSSDQVHLAGNFQGNPQDIPLLFHTYDNNGDIKQAYHGQVTTLIAGPDIAYLVGVPGGNAFVYGTVNWGDTLSSYFFTGDTSGGDGSWIWDRVDPAGWAMVPLGVSAAGNAVQSIFYTLQPWGIGGDIVFPPRKGFFRLDLDTMENTLLLTEDFVPIGFSPDNTLMAYTEANNTIVIGAPAHINLYNLETSVTVSIRLGSESDRGGGYAVFSPDNHYVAWMEATGPLMSEVPSFHTRVLIADQDGVLQAEVPVSDLGSVAADPTARWAVPAGWVDAEHLLVKVQGENWERSALVSMRYDGSNPSYVAPGRFLDFVYP